MHLDPIYSNHARRCRILDLHLHRVSAKGLNASPFESTLLLACHWVTRKRHAKVNKPQSKWVNPFQKWGLGPGLVVDHNSALPNEPLPLKKSYGEKVE